MFFTSPFSILSSLSYLYKTSTQYSKQKSTSSEQTPNSSEKSILSEQKPISSENPILSEQNPASSTASKKFSRINSNSVNSRKRFKNYVAFGDSFSDNGNSYNLTNKIWPTDVNYEGHFTNGKVWTEYLAELLNIKLINYAYGGATSNSEFIQGCTGPKSEFQVYGIKQQIEMFIAANTKSKNKNSNSSTLKKFLKSNKIKKSKKVKDFSRTLFSVWDTGNDYFFSEMRASPLEVVKSLIDALHLLVNSFPSINTILIPNIHDLSRIPAFKTCDIEEKTRISKMIESHNKYLLEHLVKFSRETGVRIIYLKIDKFTKELQTKDGMSCFGISNCVDAAVNLYNNNSEINNDEIVDLNNNDDHKNKDTFLFWDDYHLTTLVHDALANLSFEILEDLSSPLSIHKRNSIATKTFALTLGDYIQ